MTAMWRLPTGLNVVSLNRSETEYLYKEIFEDRAYLPPTGFILPNEPVVFDVGANIGLFTVFALQQWPHARVFSFEPVPQIYEALHRNVAGLANVVISNVALGRTVETRSMTYYPRYTMMSGFDADPATDRGLVVKYIGNVAENLDEKRGRRLLAATDELLEGRFQAELVSCAVMPLAEIVASYNVDHIDLLKIDVEGFEVEVLQGIGELLWPCLGNAVVEVADRAGQLTEVQEMFHAHGMQTTIRQSREYRNTGLFMVYATRAR
jgi:31-O-methyltransferase